MSSIVCREICARRLAHVHRAEQQIRSAFQDLLRHAGPEVAGDLPTRLGGVVEAASESFERDLASFIAHFDGIELDLGAENLTETLFHRYFEGLPPFGGGRDKKHEFPDAATLLSLENYAAQNCVAMIVVSKDNGWASYAATSSRIYCVATVQALTDLFESTSDDARKLRQLVASELMKDVSTIARIREIVAKRLSVMNWKLPISRDYRYLISGGLQDIHVQLVDHPTGEPRLWLAGPDRRFCVVQLSVDAEVMLDIEMTIKDCVTNEPPEILYERTHERVEVQVLLRLAGNLFSSSIENWEIEVDVVDETFTVEPAFVQSRLWRKVRKGFHDDFEDDIPF